MSPLNEEKVRIVVKKKGHGGGHHGGAWKVAYADFVTTMMALFIVLWIVGQNAAVKHAVAAYFRNPGVFKETAQAALAPGGSGVLPGAAPEAPPVEEKKEETPQDKATEEKALQDVAGRIKDLMDKGGAFENLREQIRIEVTAEGLRIELREQEGSTFFQVGSPVPTRPLKPLLESLQKVIGALPNHITIEGHTDGRQYSDRVNYSNWELSTDRAHVARRFMEADGLPRGRVDRIVGHADRILAVPGDPLNPSNRRITLLVRRHNR